MKNGASAVSITNFKSLTMTASTAGTIENVSKITIKKGDNVIGSFTGTDSNDTLTISKGAVLTANSIDLGAEGKDTIAVNGTLVLTGSEIYAAKITGKGEIAAASDVYEDLYADFARTLDVGTTSENFRGTA